MGAGEQNGESDQLELLSFEHWPMRAPRPDVIGEMVMSAKWRELMQAFAPTALDECDEYAFRGLMHTFPRALTQRHASVAASFVNWLGTNCGRGFLHQAARMVERIPNIREAYTAAWAIENTRHDGRNGGRRTIEAALVTQDQWPNHAVAPDLTADDCEVVETVVIWLSMRDGQRFLADCEAEISRRLDEQRAERMREFEHRRHAATGNRRDAWR